MNRWPLFKRIRDCVRMALTLGEGDGFDFWVFERSVELTGFNFSF